MRCRCQFPHFLPQGPQLDQELPVETVWILPVSLKCHENVHETLFKIEVGSVWKLTTNKPNTVNDIFTFLAPLPTTGAELDKLSVKKVGVFPNPYLAFNPLETNKLGRFVTFNNLPPQVKISIFAVSGHLVRVLEKDGSDQFMRWDLLNRSGMPIASGIYLAYVDMPGIGETKILKVAIVLEAEILDNF